jgi:hypothetical protein
LTRSAFRTAKLLFAVTATISFSQIEAQDAISLDTARMLWQESGFANYRFNYRKYCECKRDEPPQTFVTVEDGSVSRVHHRYPDSDREVPAPDRTLDVYWTIDDLFDNVDAALNSDAVVRVQFDRERGFPTMLFIDYYTDLAGDETDLRGISLEPR